MIKPKLSVVIPTLSEPSKTWECQNPTMVTIKQQIFKDFRIVVVWDQFKQGAAWARNEGFKSVDTEFVLFSDDDITWKPEALRVMVETLESKPEASYCYGAYRCNWTDPDKIYTIGWQEFDAKLLKQKNFISTMSIIRSKDFPGFDESLKRHQDWDLWLTMLEQGKTGVFCGSIIFETRLGNGGVSFGSIPISRSQEIIRGKHRL